MSTSATAKPLDVDALRADFPILATHIHARGDDPGVPLVYLDNAATTQRPRQVIQSVVDVYERQYANVHRGIHWLSDQTTDLYEQSRAKVRAFINAPALEQVIFTHGTTESVNLVARSWGDANLRPGDEVLLTEMEHHANLVPWQQAAERTGAVLRHIPITDDGRLDQDTLPRLLGERTKLVAVTAVSNVLGTVNPVAEIIAQAHAVGAVVLVDAAQSAPHLATDVQALNADFVAFSGHKMLGPSGVGVLWGRGELLDAMPPFLGGGSMIRRVYLDRFEPAELPSKFEAGTPPIVSAIGLGAAIDYLQAIGLPAIHEHEQLLCRRAHALLADLPGVRMLGPAPEHKSGIVSFTLDRIHAHDIAQVLDRHGVAIRAGHHCAMPLHKRLGINASARASFYFYNTLDEVDRFVAALADCQRVFSRRRT
ncbi:MAG TPA: cysteine desulfurase [Pirellulales bacterium]|jgi:cysteine desulfurase/selenocysteine lyase|nr:cysteine desulfurase [Pirellulales bacterium]